METLPEGFRSWDEYDAYRKATGPSMRSAYPNKFTEFIATNPLTNFLVPGAEKFLQRGGSPSAFDIGLGALDVATGPLPAGAMLGSVVKKLVSKPKEYRTNKKRAVTLKEFLTDLFSKPIPTGSRLGRSSRAGGLGRNKIYAEVRAASGRGEISDLTRGKGIGYTNIDSAQDAWIREGTLDNWIPVAPAGGAQHLSVAKTWQTGKGYLPNVPEQRKFLKELKTENYPNSYGGVVDGMTDKEVAAHLKDYQVFLATGARDKAYMRPLGSAHVSFNPSGVKGQHIVSNPELQRQAVSMTEKDVLHSAKSHANNYIVRSGLTRSQVDDSTYNNLVNYLARNIRERNRQFLTSPTLWQLGDARKQPMLVLQTHHGNPIRYGGSSVDPRNLWAASGGLQQSGTHRVAHNIQPKVLEEFYRSLMGKHYNPYLEEALKTTRRGEEPYSGFLDLIQETDPSLWDYNMRNAYNIFK